MINMGRKILKFRIYSLLFTSVAGALMAERERWPLWLPVLLGGGISIYFALPVEPPLWLGWTGFSLFGALAVAAHRRSSAQAMAWLAISFVALGLGLGGLRTWWVAAPVITQKTGPVTVEGQIVKIEARPKGMRVTLDHVNVQRLKPDAMPRRVRITLSAHQPVFAPGDWLKVRANLAPPPPPAQPGAFDFQRQSYFRGLGGVGFAYGRATVTGRAPHNGIDSLRFSIERLRLGVSKTVRSALDGPQGAVAAALMTGDRGSIPVSVLDNMRSSGLAHLLAISGLHVGLIASIVFFTVRAGLALIRPLALGFPIKKWAAGTAILGAGGYALLAGATVPTQRAFLMISLVFLAVLLDRRALSMRTVAWAALVILVVSPESLLGVSFQLSFAAVVALIAVYEALSGTRLLEHRKSSRVQVIGRYILTVALTTLVAGLATAAFAAFHFNRVADFSLAANLVAVPLTALWIMPWAVAAYVLMPFGWEAWALTPMGWGIDGVLLVAKTVSHWPGAVRHIQAFPLWGLTLISLGGLWLSIWRGRWRFLGLPLAALSLVSFAFTAPPDVLIDRTGKLAAVKTQTGGYVVSTLRSKRFDQGVWLRRAGLIQVEGRWPLFGLKKSKRTRSLLLRCDALGCIYTGVKRAGAEANRPAVAFIFNPEALREDCARTPVVVSLRDFKGALPPCAAQVYITFEDLQNFGAHALYFTAQGIRVETVRQRRGDRPWVIGAQRRR